MQIRRAAPVQHPLYGATLRVDRAAKHIEELRTALQEWTDLHGDILTANMAADGTVFFEPKDDISIEPLATASVVIGDVLYNLRAALDYTVYAIAVDNNKQRHVAGTQFPIEDDPDMFTARITGKHPSDNKRVAQYLRKVPPSAVAHIRTLQPFAGTIWTGSLRELSNPDKHRTTTALSSRSQFSGQMERLPDGTPVAVKGNFEVEVWFGGTKTDAIDTLRTFEREVRATIETFRPSFATRKKG